MLRKNSIYPRTFACIFFSTFFLYFFILNRYHLIYQEQIQLFIYNKAYLLDFLKTPGGLGDYAGSFLTQFFIFPLAGASILTFAGLSIFLVTRDILEEFGITGISWSLIPVLILAALHSYHLYEISFTLCLFLSLAFFSIFLRIKADRPGRIFILISWPILYCLTGGYALVFLSIYLLHQLLFRSDTTRMLISLALVIFLLFVPYLMSGTLFYIRRGSELAYYIPLFFSTPYKQVLLFSLIYWPLIIILFFLPNYFLKIKRTVVGQNWRTELAGMILVVSFSGLTYIYIYDPNTEKLLGIDYSVQQSDWDKALALSQSSTEPNRIIAHFTNLALYKTNRMGNNLFHFPQRGSEGLWLDWEQDWLISFFGGEIYYQLGYNSEAYRWAYETMVAKGPNPRSLKRLALTSIIDDNLALAEKYLRILEQTLFYGNWARNYLNFVNSPELMEKDPEISEKKHFRLETDFLNSDNFGVRLPYILEDHPDNRMAFEYLMASFMLEKDLEGFIANIGKIKKFGYKTLPVHYEEALVAYMSSANTDIVPDGYSISQGTIRRLNDYFAAIEQYGDNTNRAAKELYNKFGKTYWYYLKFN